MTRSKNQIRIALAVVVVTASCQRASDSDHRSTADIPTKSYEHKHATNTTPQGPAVLPPPTNEQLRRLENALAFVEEADADMRYIAALSGLMHASSGRIPSQLAADLLAYNDAPTRERSAALLRVFDNSAWLFDEVCGQSFESLFAEGRSTRDRGSTARHVWTECRLERYPLLDDEAEFVASSDRVGPEPMVAHFVYAYLELHGGAHPMETELLRSVAAGIPPEAQMPDDIQDWLSAQ